MLHTMTRQDRENLKFFKKEKRQEFISNITARSGMDESKLSKMDFKTLRELNKGLTPQVNQEAVKAMQTPSTAEIIRNGRTDRRKALIEHLLEKSDQFSRAELEALPTSSLEDAASVADRRESAEVSAMQTPSTADLIKNKRN